MDENLSLFEENVPTEDDKDEMFDDTKQLDVTEEQTTDSEVYQDANNTSADLEQINPDESLEITFHPEEDQEETPEEEDEALFPLHETVFPLQEEEDAQERDLPTAQVKAKQTKRELPKSDRELRSEVRKLRTGKIIPDKSGRELGLLSMDFFSNTKLKTCITMR